MKKMNLAIITGTLALALGLSACGGTATEPQASPEPQAAPEITQEAEAVAEVEAFNPDNVNGDTMGDRDWDLYPKDGMIFLSEGGALGTLEVVENTDPRVADIEEYRKATGAVPLTYLVAEVDNRQGKETAQVSILSMFDLEGEEYDFKYVGDSVDEWGPTYSMDYEYVMPNGTKVSEAEASRLDAMQDDLGLEYPNIKAKAKKTVVLATEDMDIPEMVTGVSLYASGMSEAGVTNPMKMVYDYNESVELNEDPAVLAMVKPLYDLAVDILTKEATAGN